MVTRILLFLVTNLAVVLVLNVVLRVLGVDRMLGNGGQVNGLLILALVMGFGGSIISLLLSKWSARRATGAQVIASPANPTEQWLVDTVGRLAAQAGIGMPEVAIYEAPEINAFATGASRDHALVAVSTGLLNGMSAEEAQAVLGHEITHVANGDMITLALIQGVVNTFVIFFARIIASLVDRSLSRSERSGPGIAYFVSSMIAEVLLGIAASAIVMWFSRRREFRADAGGARLASRDHMIAALERLKLAYEPSSLPEGVRAFGIAGGGGLGLRALFLSHPPLDQRIAALRAAAADSGLRLH